MPKLNAISVAMFVVPHLLCYVILLVIFSRF